MQQCTITSSLLSSFWRENEGCQYPVSPLALLYYQPPNQSSGIMPRIGLLPPMTGVQPHPDATQTELFQSATRIAPSLSLSGQQPR